MLTASQHSLGARPCLRTAAQQPRPRARNVVMAAQQKDKQQETLPKLAAAAGIAAIIFTSQPALALAPTLFESNEKNAQELQDIIAARTKGLPDLRDVPKIADKATQAVKDTPLDKIAGKVKETTVDVPSSVPTPLPPTPGADVSKARQSPPTPAQPPAPKKIASPQGATPAAPSLPSAPSAPAPPNNAVLGVGAIAVAAAGAFLAAGKQGQLPDGASQVEAAAKDAAGKAEGAAKDAAGKAEGAAKSAAGQAEGAAKSVANKVEGGANGAEQTAEEAAAAAKANAGEAREWIEAWRKKQ